MLSVCVQSGCANDVFVMIMPDYDEYNPGESPASIRLYVAYYTVVFRPGEFL